MEDDCCSIDAQVVAEVEAEFLGQYEERECDMPTVRKILRPALTVVFSLVIWWIGIVALISGHEEIMGRGLALFIFAAVCTSLWFLLKLSEVAAISGLLVVGLWGVALFFSFLMNYRDSIRDLFFWAVIVVLLSTATALAFSGKPSNHA